MMQKLIVDHKLPAIKDANIKIDNLCDVVNSYKQSEEIRKLELQFKLSENYKLEIAKDIKIKELDIAKDIRIKELDFQIKELDTKKVAMEKGYDLSYLTKNISKNSSKKAIKKTTKKH